MIVPDSRKLAAALGALALASLAVPSSAQGSERSAVFTCTDGTVFDARFVEVDHLQAVLVQFPDGRIQNGAARMLLPLSQSGSGVRYASDIAQLHMKGKEASFAVQDSAFSARIERTRCVARFDGAEPLTQSGSGDYRVLGKDRAMDDTYPRDRPARRADAICFARDGQSAIALRPTGAAEREAELIQLTASSRKVRTVRVGEVDPGAGQRRYDLFEKGSEMPVGTMHFIAPGMSLDGTVNADAHLSSVTIGDARTECLDLQDALYAGFTDWGLVTVIRDETGPKLALPDNVRGDEFDAGAPRFAVGKTGGGIVLYVFEEGRFAAISDRGSGHELVLYDYRRSGDVPTAFFIAPDEELVRGLPRLDERSVRFLELLPLCTHLAGEWAGMPERDEQVSDSWQEGGCEALEPLFESLSRDVASDSVMGRFLQRISLFSPYG